MILAPPPPFLPPYPAADGSPHGGENPPPPLCCPTPTRGQHSGARHLTRFHWEDGEVEEILPLLDYLEWRLL